MFMDLKTKLETTSKTHQALILNLEAKFDRLADKQSARPSGSLPSNTQPNPQGNPPKSYTPPQAQNVHNPDAFDSDDENEESTPKPQPQIPKPKEAPTPKPYKPRIPYPQRLRKEKMEAQYQKFLNRIQVVRINVPLVDVLAGMPNYGKFLKELISNKHKLEQNSSAFLSDESSTIIQNKVPPKLEDPRSFLVPSENMLVKVGKFTFLADFVILEMEEDNNVPLILGRPFLHTADAVIRVKQKQLNLGVGSEQEDFDALLDEENTEPKINVEEIPFEKITFNIDYKVKKSLEEPPTDLELKSLPNHLEYALLEEPSFLPVIISSQLSKQNKKKLISVLKRHRQAFA
ncbi:reverse transcriptase domain-containing protein [Tanacetum coccineum]